MENIEELKHQSVLSRVRFTDSELRPVPNVSLEFRCPQCFKLYKVDPSHIHSSEPQFECQVCHAQFTFEYPPRNPKAIYTKSLSLPQVGKLNKKQTLRQSYAENSSNLVLFKTCPKCLTKNPRGNEECFKCGVLMSKAEIVSKVGTTPSLIKMWQELLNDYSNITKHMAFVDRCEDLQALPFAMKKYKELKEVQPQDSLADQMFNSVLIKSFSQKASEVSKHPKVKWLFQIPWNNVLRVSPLVFSFLFMLIGLFSPGSRNFAGFGVTLLVLTLGLAYFLKGRIRLSDFWETKI